MPVTPRVLRGDQVTTITLSGVTWDMANVPVARRVRFSLFEAISIPLTYNFLPKQILPLIPPAFPLLQLPVDLLKPQSQF